jgi:hypothetical protein
VPVKYWTFFKESACCREYLVNREIILLTPLVYITYGRIPIMQHLLTILIVEHLRKVFPRPKVPPSITSGACTDSVTLSWVIWTILRTSGYYYGFRRSKD